jgi:hypothetical protein
MPYLSVSLEPSDEDDPPERQISLPEKLNKPGDIAILVIGGDGRVIMARILGTETEAEINEIRVVAGPYIGGIIQSDLVQ